MKHFILMNKKTGALGLGCRVSLYDQVVDFKDDPLFEKYNMTLRITDYDGWLIFAGGDNAPGPWIWLKRESVDGKVEILGEL